MKILVAGAGHGGLTAAAILAKAGHSVTVYEKQNPEDIGYDWEDRFTFSLLSDIVGKNAPASEWRYRGDCTFVSPNGQTSVVINYTDENRQKIMRRKYIIRALIENAQKNGVEIKFGTSVAAPTVSDSTVTGLVTSDGEVSGDLVIDAAGAFSPVRSNLPASFGIEQSPSRGDVFYAYRAYFRKKDGCTMSKVPFEVYLRHNDEQGLSWFCENSDSVDILIGRIDPLSDERIEKNIDLFRKSHPCTGDKKLLGGRGIIPVRRPLALMVANGYAAVGDSAFMTTPMNGMGLDLSLQAGKLLAETVITGNNASAKTLWKYNRDFHVLYGGDTAKNESLKNALLNLPDGGVDFLFKNGVIQASDLAGAGRNTNLGALLGKFVRGMKNPPFFFAILGGIMNGGKLSKVLKSAPAEFDLKQIGEWQNKVIAASVKVTRGG